jgi:hypothetical protein
VVQRFIAKSAKSEKPILHREPPLFEKSLPLNGDFKILKNVVEPYFRTKITTQIIMPHTFSWDCPFKLLPVFFKVSAELSPKISRHPHMRELINGTGTKQTIRKTKKIW